MQCIDTQTQLPRPLLLSCRVCLSCVGKVYTCTQAEPGPTRLLPNHLGLPQTNELGQCTATGGYRSSSHKEECCLPHGTHTTNDPDSLTCRPDVGRRSALVGHIGRYGRHQADVGSISGQIGHICRYGRHLADIEPTCKHGVGPISADMRRYRPDIISDIRPISRPTFPDIGPTSGRSFCAIWEWIDHVQLNKIDNRTVIRVNVLPSKHAYVGPTLAQRL